MNIWWAVGIVVILPALIIAAAELDERLRQRESPLRPAVQILRTWSLPFFAIWTVLVPVLGLEGDSFVVRIVGSGLVLSLAVVAARILQVLLGRLGNREQTPDRRPIPQLLLAVPKIILLLTTIWLLLSTVWGVDLSAALTALGVTSLVVSFALQDTLSGLASGMLLLSDQPFKPGDWINTGETTGKVLDINWRTSRILDRNGDLTIVPNSQLANASLVNYSTPEPLLRVTVTLQVAFVNPPTLAKAMILDAARGIPGVLAEPAPDVKVTSIDDPLMEYEVQMWIDDYAIAPRVRSDFGSLVWYQSHRHEVPLPSPAQDLYLYDGVANAEANTPTTGEISALFHKSPLLASLPPDDLDRLAHASRRARYAIGEPLSTSQGSLSELLVIVEGRAMLSLTDDQGAVTAIGEVSDGELVGLIESSPIEGHVLHVRALTDCEVLIIEATAAAEIASRNPDLSAALNRSTAIRRRRIERVVQHRARLLLDADGDPEISADRDDTDNTDSTDSTESDTAVDADRVLDTDGDDETSEPERP